MMRVGNSLKTVASRLPASAPLNGNKNEALFSYILVLVIFIIVVVFTLHPESDSFNTKFNNLRGNDAYLLKNAYSVGSLDSLMNKHFDVDHLIIVPGHSVLRVEELNSAHYNENAWYLLKYQKDQDFAKIIYSHISKGVELAKWDHSSLLVFSGGQTRKDVGPTSEAASYYYVAKYRKLFASSVNILDRVYLEEHARDSFENLLFSICRFYEVTGRYPKKITMVGFDFKRDRFVKLHRYALKFPEHLFTYVGIRPTSANKNDALGGTVVGFNHQRALIGEKEVVNAYTSDLYGCEQGQGVSPHAQVIAGVPVHDENGMVNSTAVSVKNTQLTSKRNLRNPFKRSIPYTLSNPQLLGLLQICDDPAYAGVYASGKKLYNGDLPWTV